MVQRQFIGTTSPSNNLRKGNILVLTLVSLIAVFAFVAFSIDIGALVSARSDLQNAADAAARAGARHLPEDIGTVETVAKNFTEKNPVADKIITLEPDEDLEIGFWNTKLREFTVLNKSEIQDANAVRTTIRMNQSRGNMRQPLFRTLTWDRFGRTRIVCHRGD